MIIPQKPPVIDFSKSRELFPQFGLEYGGKYIHWDDLRRRKMPQGLTHEDVWATLKYFRGGLAKRVPLTDLEYRNFTFVMYDPLYEMQHFIDLEAGGTILSDDVLPTDVSKQRYITGTLIEESITSSQLEGAATTRKVAKEMIQSGRKPRTEGERMIYNNYETMRAIRELKNKPLTPQIVREIHNIVTLDTVPVEECGNFRTAETPVEVVERNSGQVVHTPPPADQLETRMQALCDFANGNTPKYFIHPVTRSIILHFWLAYDHPFTDGNGRCARSLFYWSMLHHGYWLAEYISISRLIKPAPAKYSRAFQLTQIDDNDLTYFILYHLDLLKRAVNDVREHIKKESTELTNLVASLQNMRELNDRQRIVMSHALRNPRQEYTASVHQKALNIRSNNTARRDLNDLVDRGYLESVRVGKEYRYYPVPTLADKLRS